MASPGFSGFDLYVIKHGIKEDEVGAALVAWMNEIRGGEWDGEFAPLVRGEE